MNLCNFVIHPSVSEGGAPSVLTCMGNGGLIPIVSESSGLDIKQGYGLIIKELSKDKIENKINEALQMDIKKIKEISKIIKNETSKEYTIEKYKQNLKQIITNFIKENAL
jgi:glycosyltransferase involved in cell wall biosynthesis